MIPRATFEAAFDSTNRMVVGGNPYLTERFVAYFDHPDVLHEPTNVRGPRGRIDIAPDGYLRDFYGWPVAATFDTDDNLYIYDANRGQIRIYWDPFGLKGDCNNDSAVDAGDLSAEVLEIFDGDGTAPTEARGGTFAGDPVGCNPNLDRAIDAGDLACTVLTIFNGPDSCRSP